jgi:hypothetical protein
MTADVKAIAGEQLVTVAAVAVTEDKAAVVALELVGHHKMRKAKTMSDDCKKGVFVWQNRYGPVQVTVRRNAESGGWRIRALQPVAMMLSRQREFLDAHPARFVDGA